MSASRCLSFGICVLGFIFLLIFLFTSKTISATTEPGTSVHEMNVDDGPKTFRVCNKAAEKYRYRENQRGSVAHQINTLRKYESIKCTYILQMSNFPEKSFASDNGFVHAVVRAYSDHHNLVIRPDDIWAAIMTQFSFYINKHAVEFRTKFVNFEGKKRLAVFFDGTLRNASYQHLVKLMNNEIKKNLIDPGVKNWILPNFTTTTENDVVTTGVVFMAIMKKYFRYQFWLGCGIPEITLEGTAEDWQSILSRLEKLKEYKLESWYDMLKPVILQFVAAKRGNVDKDFWQRMVHHERLGSGTSAISGWITVFCRFDEEGDWNGYSASSGILDDSTEPTETGRNWLVMGTDAIPAGIVEVDITIIENGVEFDSIQYVNCRTLSYTSKGSWCNVTTNSWMGHCVKV